jgi:hypothetical protein
VPLVSGMNADVWPRAGDKRRNDTTWPAHAAQWLCSQTQRTAPPQDHFFSSFWFLRLQGAPLFEGLREACQHDEQAGQSFLQQVDARYVAALHKQAQPKADELDEGET